MTSETNIPELMRDIALRARAAYFLMSEATNEQKNIALNAAAVAVRARVSEIIAANEKDLEYGREKGLDAAMLDSGDRGYLHNS